MNRSEKHLIDSIRKGDKHSFEELFRAYYNRLCIYACTFVYQPDDAENIVKDVFVKMWEDREKIQIETSHAGYLYTAVRNQCINYIQREWRKQNKHIISLSDEKHHEAMPSDTPDALECMEVQELEERVAQLIEMLPPQCREIFRLSRNEDLSYSEIAQTLNVSLGTVKTQVFRALAKIRAGLADYLPTIIAAIFFARG